MRAMMAMGLAAALAACSPGDTKKVDPHAIAAPTPSNTMAETFGTHCTWGEVKGATLSIWSYACGPEGGDVRLVADDAVPGFRFESAAANGADLGIPIRVFTKPADAPIDAVLPAVRAASPGPATDTCVFAPTTGVDDAGHGRFNLVPTGASKTAWESSITMDASEYSPCGELGVSFSGDRTFEVMADHPDKVLFIDFGSEIQIFDASTIKLVAAEKPAPH